MAVSRYDGLVWVEKNSSFFLVFSWLLSFVRRYWVIKTPNMLMNNVKVDVSEECECEPY